MRRKLFGFLRGNTWVGATVCSLALLFGALGVFSNTSILDASAVMAQENDDEITDETAEGPAEGPADRAPAVESPVAGAPAPAGEEQTTLGWMYQSLGLFYSIVFLGLSFTLVALFVMNLMAIRRETVIPTALVDNFDQLLKEKKYQDAFEMARTDESFAGQVLAAGLAKLKDGYPQAIEAMQEIGEEETMKMEHRLSYMALIGTISPMVGLLGTVQGMIASFRVIATSPTTPKPSELAEGISTALFTTLVGLFIAIPAIAAFGILRNRVARLVLEVGRRSEEMMSRFQPKAQPKKAQ